MPSIVFLCVENSARSQMAEGLARARAPEGWDVHSAGSRPGTLHPHAVQALQEIGIDISHHHAKGFDAVPLEEADVVVTLCAEEECPVVVTRGRRLSWPLPDPAGADRDQDIARRFRAVRDDLIERLDALWRRVADA